MSEKFVLGFLFVIAVFATGYLYGHDLGKAENDAQISRASQQLKKCNMVLAGIYQKEEE